MSVGAEGSERPTPGAARTAAQQLPHEDSGVVRVREAPAGVGLGRELSGGPPQRDSIAAHFVFAVPALPALFPPQLRPVPGQAALRSGERS